MSSHPSSKTETQPCLDADCSRWEFIRTSHSVRMWYVHLLAICSALSSTLSIAAPGLQYNTVDGHSEYVLPSPGCVIVSINPDTRSYTANPTAWPGATLRTRGVIPL